MNHSFTAPLQRISAKGGSHLAVVPPAIATLLNADGEGSVTWHAGLNPLGGGRFYVQVGRNYHEPLGYSVGDQLPLKLIRDESNYGMQPCEEFLAVAESDPEGERLLRAHFTPGTQRTLLHRIAAGRTSRRPKGHPPASRGPTSRPRSKGKSPCSTNSTSACATGRLCWRACDGEAVWLMVDG